MRDGGAKARLAPAFMCYANDWLSSRKITLMSPALEGAYIRLLCYMWTDPDCSLPDDDNELAVLSRLGEDWKLSATKLRECFTPHPRKPGRLINARMFEERKKQEVWRKKCRDGGIRSGKTRAMKASREGTVEELCLKGSSSVVELRSDSLSSSAPKNQTAPAIRTDVLNGHRRGFDLFWNYYPKKRNKGAAEKIWAKIRPDEALIDTMLGKIKQAMLTPDWQKERGQFIPYPASWLNAKGWEDDFQTTTRKERLPV